MPHRNLLIIAAASIISLACYTKNERQPFARLLRYAMGLVQKEYVEPIEGRQLYEGAMDGVLGKLDPHSGYIAPEEYHQFRQGIDQEFGGIGIVVEPKADTNQILVTSPLVGTPAFEAGIRAGDVIVRVDETDVQELSFARAVKKLRGKPGSTVTLELERPGEKQAKVLELERRIIEIESVLGDFRLPSGEWQYRLEGAGEIAYVRIIQFGEHTASEVSKAIKKFETPRALILDLRGNPGGLLDSALEICDMFLDEGTIVSVRGREGLEPEAEHRAHPGMEVARALPMVVLVNQYSASASEIVTACLQDHKRAAVLGERSYGKGSVQKLFEIEGGAAAIKLTTASYWRPSGHNIHRSLKAKETEEWGVLPDAGLAIPLSAEQLQKVMDLRRQRDIVGPLPRSAKAPPAAAGEKEESPAVKETTPPVDDPSQARESEAIDTTRETKKADSSEFEMQSSDPLVVDIQLKAAVEYLRGLIAGQRSE